MEGLLEGLKSAPMTVLAVAIVLGLAIFFHEAGHFLAARLLGVGVEEFAIGFGPVLWSRRRKGTLYSIRALPFGGFVRIAGMEPGTRDVPGGLYTKPRWAQAMVMVAGVAMQIVLAMLLYFVVIYAYGVPKPGEKGVVVKKVFEDMPAAAAGFKEGDRIVAVDGHRYSTTVEEVTDAARASKWHLRKNISIAKVMDSETAAAGEITKAIADAGPGQCQVVLLDPEAQQARDLFKTFTVTVTPELAAQAAQVAHHPARAAEFAGKALGVKWAEMSSGAFADYIAHRPGKPVQVTLERDGQLLNLVVTPAAVWERVPEPGPGGMLRTPHRRVGRIGVVLGAPVYRPNLAKCGALAVGATVNSVLTMLAALKAMLVREIAPEIGGPVAIMAMTAEQARIGLGAVLNWGGLINANLAIVNLLPFPPFDGFYLVLIGWEFVTR
ncbi:MAG: site-2 protease family protein, partial [Armatimonadetes bacterium]|nr:site-2 protease family protein [Armatimonadota bacterium]